MGTGSTALAALKTDRNYLGAEINSEYFEVAQKRIKEVFKYGGDTVSQSDPQGFFSKNDDEKQSQ